MSQPDINATVKLQDALTYEQRNINITNSDRVAARAAADAIVIQRPTEVTGVRTVPPAVRMAEELRTGLDNAHTLGELVSFANGALTTLRHIGHGASASTGRALPSESLRNVEKGIITYVNTVAENVGVEAPIKTTERGQGAAR